MGEQLGSQALRGDIFAVTGDLGSGKTVLAKGIASGLGVKDVITSPTFTLCEIYSGAMELYHFDLYRIDSPAELENLNFQEYWYGQGVSVIEWAERAGDLLSGDLIRIRLEYIDDRRRRMVIEYPDNRHLIGH